MSYQLRGASTKLLVLPQKSVAKVLEPPLQVEQHLRVLGTGHAVQAQSEHLQHCYRSNLAPRIEI